MARLTREGGRRETDMPASERRGAAYELRGVIGARPSRADMIPKGEKRMCISDGGVRNGKIQM